VCTIGGVEKKYGVDFVHLGWLPGGDAGKNLFLEDVWAACPQDHYGTPVEDIPMMQNIKSIDDIAWLGDMTSTPFWWINAFIAAGAEDKYIAVAKQGCLSMDKAYFQAGNIGGYIDGYMAAQYETLMGRAGYAARVQTALGLTLMTIIVIIIITSLWKYLPFKDMSLGVTLGLADKKEE
jgi:hypothetical protein